MSTETITFANFSPATNPIEDIYRIGAIGENPAGVIQQLAYVYDYELTERPDADNLNGLRELVGGAKELQSNIASVRKTLGGDAGALDLARGWVENSGLLTPVERSFMRSDLALPEVPAVAVITGGVRNWMARSADALLKLKQRGEQPAQIDFAFLGGGTRRMRPQEGPDAEGRTEAKYLDDIVRPRLERAGIETYVEHIASDNGDNVMLDVAETLVGQNDLLRPGQPIIFMRNAGAAIQGAGSLRRGLRHVGHQTMGHEHFDGKPYDENDRDADRHIGEQLFIATDSFPLGETGKEPTTTHQNPLTALGMVIRNTIELARAYEAKK